MVVTNYDHAKKELNFFCVDFRKLNAIMKKNPSLLSFIDELLNIIVDHNTYSFLDGFLLLVDFHCTRRPQNELIFLIDWGEFLLLGMPFGVKNKSFTC
jgi:hypothetical protein